MCHRPGPAPPAHAAPIALALLRILLMLSQVGGIREELTAHACGAAQAEVDIVRSIIG